MFAVNYMTGIAGVGFAYVDHGFTAQVEATSRNMAGAHVPIPDANMDIVTFAVGPRAHFKFGKTMWIRPGISYARGLDAPLTTTSFNVVQVDVPVIF